jgi:hypothetical protein
MVDQLHNFNSQKIIMPEDAQTAFVVVNVAWRFVTWKLSTSVLQVSFV